MKISVFLISVWLVCMSPSNGFSTSQEVEDLKNQVRILQKKVDMLEQRDFVETSVIPSQHQPSHHNIRSPLYDIFQLQQYMSQKLEESLQSPNITSDFMKGMPYDHADYKIQDMGKKYVIEIDITDFDQDTINVDSTDDTIVFSGEKTKSETQKSDAVFFQSQSFSSFTKTISAPLDADMSKIKFETTNNHFLITLPKK